MEPTFAEKMPPKKRRKIQAWSIAANCFGSLSEVMLDSSAILISYVALLGGNESLNMLMAGATGFIALLLQIPSGLLVEKIGLKRGMYLSCAIGCAACLLMAGAPAFGGAAKYAVVALCFAYCIARPIFGAAWFPIVDSFVAPSERGSYFGMLRFSPEPFSTLRRGRWANIRPCGFCKSSSPSAPCCNSRGRRSSAFSTSLRRPGRAAEYSPR